MPQALTWDFPAELAIGVDVSRNPNFGAMEVAAKAKQAFSMLLWFQHGIEAEESSSKQQHAPSQTAFCFSLPPHYCLFGLPLR